MLTIIFIWILLIGNVLGTDPADTELCQEILQFSRGSVSAEGSSLFLNDLKFLKIIDENEDDFPGYYFISATDDYNIGDYICKDKNWWLIFPTTIEYDGVKPLCDFAVGRCQKLQLSQCDHQWAFKKSVGSGHYKDTDVISLIKTECE
eukprot:443214_1